MFQRIAQLRQILSTRPWWVVVLATGLLFTGMQWRLLLGQYTPGGDADRLFAPYYVLLADHVRSGQFLLWDPWTHGGAPKCALAELGAFSPLTLLAALVTGGSLGGFVAYWLTLWFLGGVGMLRLARHLGAPPWGAAVVMLGFLYNGFFLGHAQHTPWIYSFAALPWIVWRIDAALCERRLLPAAQAGALIGLSALAGDAGVVACNLCTVGLWTLGRVMTGMRDDDRWLAALRVERLAPVLSAAPWGLGLRKLLLAACVAAAVMSPPYVIYRQETRGFLASMAGSRGETAAGTAARSPQTLLSLATPQAAAWTAQYGNNGELPGDPSGLSLYLGIGCTWLAVAAVCLQPCSAWRWWLAGCFVLGIGLALLPGVPWRMRVPAMCQSLSPFVAAVLAALASRDLAKAWREARPLPVWRLAAAALIVGGMALAAYRGWLVTLPAVGADHGKADLLAYAGWGSLCVLGWLAWQSTRGRAWQNALAATLCMVAAADAMQTCRVSRPRMVYNSPTIATEWSNLTRNRPRALDLTAVSGLEREPRVEIGPLLGAKHLLGKTPVLDDGASLANPIHEAWMATPCLQAAATGAKRIWFAPTALAVPPSDAAWAAFRRRSAEVQAPVMVVHEPHDLVRSPQTLSAAEGERARAVEQLPAARAIAARVDEYRPNTLALHVDCPSAGWLLVTDRWAPGWQATVNEAPAEVYGGAFLFRAVRVPRGANDVVFTYHPWGFPWVLVLSYGMLAAVALATALAARRAVRTAIPRTIRRLTIPRPHVPLPPFERARETARVG